MPEDPISDFFPPGRFLKHLERNLFESHRSVQSEQDFEIHYLDLTPLHLDAGWFIPFFVPTGLPVGKLITAGELDPIVEKVRSWTHRTDSSRYFSVVVLGNQLQYDPKKRFRNIGRHDIAVVDASAIREIYASDDPETTMAVITQPLIDYLGREKLSRYKHSTVAVAGRFFGRIDLLDRVRNRSSTSFTFFAIGESARLRY